ncbi:MAG TPA: DUF4286 family protein [Paludibacter sp.]|nr:DUF4286 family protein [Paludibacter sp.]
MLIYNTTYLVSDQEHNNFLKWIREEHIPFMLESTYFSKPQMTRIITGSEQEGTSFSVQFHVNNLQTLKLWNQKYSTLFQENCSKKFGTEVLFFTTIMELIE